MMLILENLILKQNFNSYSEDTLRVLYLVWYMIMKREMEVVTVYDA